MNKAIFIILVLIAFGFSTYISFTYFIRGRSVSTPNLIGKSLDDAKAICSDLGVSMEVDPEHRRNSDRIPAGHVVWQNRTPGTTNLVKRGAKIRVELSAGPLVLRVPNLDGQSPRTAMLRLGQQNLALGHVAYADAADKMGIVAEDPPRETVVAAQSKVALLVSAPPPPPAFVMPDLIDQPLDTVRPSLERHGLTISTVKFEAYPGIADGIVIRQFPLRGAPVSGRDPITVVVSKQEEGGIIEQPAVPAPAATTTQ
jgi:beta-lactam-binding protein with PASTA domain